MVKKTALRKALPAPGKAEDAFALYDGMMT